MLSQMYIGLDVKYLLFSSDFNDTSIFSTDFFRKTDQILNFTKIRPVGAALFEGRRKDRPDEAYRCFPQILRKSLTTIITIFKP
jgi:hypothetical protein